MKSLATVLAKLKFHKSKRAALMLCAAAALALAIQAPGYAQTLTTLQSFTGGSPAAALLQGIDGDFYSTLQGDLSSIGWVFKINSTGGGAPASLNLNTINASAPLAGLVQAANGNFYGTAFLGGANQTVGVNYGGVIFKLTPSGALTTLYSFCAKIGCSDGDGPTKLFRGTNGNLYGITVGTGVGSDQGTIFTITLGGVLTTLYRFCKAGIPCSDGESPEGLVQGADGKLYGTTLLGGGDGGNGQGTVFQLTPGGVLTTLYNFCPQGGFNCPDGSNPEAGLVQGGDGNFYGTTTFGGTGSDGTIFKISSAGALTTLHRFTGADGAAPAAALIQATDGNFYGTTSGFVVGPGTVFQVTLSGSVTTLYTFCTQAGCTDGEFSSAPLVQGTDGNFYGTAIYNQFDGNCAAIGGCGTVFRLATGLGPFVRALPTSGNVGTQVRILGTNLTGITSVSFNGTAAPFKVVSGSLINTTVPTGATTGEVTVVTSSGILSSNVAFQVN